MLRLAVRTDLSRMERTLPFTSLTPPFHKHNACNDLSDFQYPEKTGLDTLREILKIRAGNGHDARERSQCEPLPQTIGSL